MRRIWPAVMRHSTRRCTTMPAAPSSRKGNWPAKCASATSATPMRPSRAPPWTGRPAAPRPRPTPSPTPPTTPPPSPPHGAPLIRALADVSVTFGAGQASSHHQAFSSSSDGKPFSQAPLVNHATLGLQARGIYRANISVPLVDLPEGLQSYTPFDEIDLRITRHTSVLIDPWAARSVQQNMERFGKLAPLNSVFSPMETLLDVAIPAFELFGEVPAPR